ncbi:MAG: hypothetical protein LBB72_00745 [Spirochaetaceae bacterium]|jgi:hypothetical protein|nr:hypothetical protein [Spirochaetaceae bacterium]
MALTIQHRSWVSLSETGKDLAINKPETEDVAGLLLPVLDSLNKLYENLIKLDYQLDKKLLREQIINGQMQRRKK